MGRGKRPAIVSKQWCVSESIVGEWRVKDPLRERVCVHTATLCRKTKEIQQKPQEQQTIGARELSLTRE
jgi:hypothetical protein